MSCVYINVHLLFCLVRLGCARETPRESQSLAKPSTVSSGGVAGVLRSRGLGPDLDMPESGSHYNRPGPIAERSVGGRHSWRN